MPRILVDLCQVASGDQVSRIASSSTASIHDALCRARPRLEDILEASQDSLRHLESNPALRARDQIGGRGDEGVLLVGAKVAEGCRNTRRSVEQLIACPILHRDPIKLDPRVPSRISEVAEILKRERVSPREVVGRARVANEGRWFVDGAVLYECGAKFDCYFELRGEKSVAAEEEPDGRGVDVAELNAGTLA